MVLARVNDQLLDTSIFKNTNTGNGNTVRGCSLTHAIFASQMRAWSDVAFHDILPETPIYENCSYRTKSSIFGQRLSYYRRPEAELDIESGLQRACLFVPLTIDYIFPSPMMQSPLDIALDRRMLL